MEAFTFFGLGSAAAMLATLLTGGLWCRKQRIPYLAWILMAVIGIPLAWVLSRLVFCLSSLPYYLQTIGDASLMLRFQDGGASLMGAFGGLVLSAFLVEKWQKLPCGSLMDAVGLGAPLGVIIERLCEGPTGSMGHGRQILSKLLLPLGVTDDLVHPVYMYEAVAAAAILIVLLVWLGRSGWSIKHSGDVLLVFMVLFGASQVVLDSMRDDRHMLLIHFVHINQIIAIVLPVIALVIWTLRAMKNGMKKNQAIIAWLVTAAAIVIGIVQEFAVDSSENLFIDYGVMAAACAVIAIVALRMRRRAE